jgi:hypothetical protein
MGLRIKILLRCFVIVRGQFFGGFGEVVVILVVGRRSVSIFLVDVEGTAPHYEHRFFQIAAAHSHLLLLITWLLLLILAL